MACMHSSLFRLLILGLLLLGLAACGSKGPLVPADQEPPKTEPPAQ
jgi:predicted small lipoprotein YifL